MTSDPRAIAESLIEELGLSGAMKAAQEGTQAAHDADDNYSISVWREVKQALRDRITKSQ